MQGYYNSRMRDQIKAHGSEWVAQQKYWLFGTATFYDGTMISRDAAVKDAKYFFNLLDRDILSRKDYDEKRRFERLVFIETGRMRNNTHIHFFIKGRQLQDYDRIWQVSETLWPSEIKKGYNLVIKNNTDLIQERKGYCWKETYDLNKSPILYECCHIDYL